MLDFIYLNFVLFCFDPNKTHTRNFRGRTGLFIPVRPLFRWIFLLCLLGDKAAHPLGSLLLHLPGDVGVGVQGETRAVVSQDAGNCFGIHSLLDRQRCESVAKIVEAENEAIPVEVENRTWYNPLKGYGWHHSPFLLRGSHHGTKE